MSEGISRGIFVAGRFEPLMSQMRATYEALERYNRSSGRPMGSPRQVNTDALWAQTENVIACASVRSLLGPPDSVFDNREYPYNFQGVVYGAGTNQFTTGSDCYDILRKQAQ